MSPRQKFKTTKFYSILDSLTTELMKRKEVYCKLQNKFRFLFQITNLSNLELREAASNLQKHFWKDLEYAFVEELIYSVLRISEAISSRKILTASYFGAYSKCWNLFRMLTLYIDFI